jgi:LPS sulfotransferase NodH
MKLWRFRKSSDILNTKPWNYVISTTPRSGSNLLCELLSSSKLMGFPSEYLNSLGGLLPTAKDNHLIDPEGRISVGTYLDFVTENRVTQNDCFGLKILYDQLVTFGKFQAVKDFLMKSRFVWLVRRDIVSQAVSLYIASETGSWKSFEDERKTRDMVNFDEEKIQFFVNRIFMQNLKWEQFFLINHLEYLRVDYEDILADAQGACQRICGFCGVRTDHHFLIDEARYKKQGNDLNEQFVSRFLNSSVLNLGMKSHGTQEICVKGIPVIE